MPGWSGDEVLIANLEGTADHGMTRYTGNCHRVGIRFEIETRLDTTARCNCSLCKRKGAVLYYVPEEQFRIVEGEDLLTSHQWSTGKTEHHFSSRFGICSVHALK